MELIIDINAELSVVTIKPVLPSSEEDILPTYLDGIVSILEDSSTNVCKDLNALPYEVNAGVLSKLSLVFIEVVDDILILGKSTALQNILSLVQAEKSVILETLQSDMAEQRCYSDSALGFTH